MGWVYWKTGLYQQLTQGPVDKGKDGAIREAITALRDFNKGVVITNGNAGTLDALNRGEIWMGVVWIDQLVAWKNEGRMDQAVTPSLPAPGLPIYPLYLVVPREAASRDMATRYIDYIATPEVQARAIVERFGWYPGVDPDKVLPLINAKSRDSSSRACRRKISPLLAPDAAQGVPRHDHPRVRGDRPITGRERLLWAARVARPSPYSGPSSCGRWASRWWPASRGTDSGRSGTTGRSGGSMRGTSCTR
jgi:hypothetical protein